MLSEASIGFMSSENLRERVLDLLQRPNTEVSITDIAQNLDEQSTRVYNMPMTLALDNSSCSIQKRVYSNQKQARRISPFILRNYEIGKRARDVA